MDEKSFADCRRKRLIYSTVSFLLSGAPGGEAVQWCKDWFHATRHRLLACVRSRVGDEVDAELLLSGVASRVSQAVSEGRVPAQEEDLLPYTMRALCREAVHALQRSRSRAEAEQVYYKERGLDAQPDGSVSAEDDLHYHLRRAVKSLPPKQAEVLLLHVWEEQSFAAIARGLSLSESTVRSRYKAALLAVKRLMNPLTTKTDL